MAEVVDRPVEEVASELDSADPAEGRFLILRCDDGRVFAICQSDPGHGIPGPLYGIVAYCSRYLALRAAEFVCEGTGWKTVEVDIDAAIAVARERNRAKPGPPFLTCVFLAKTLATSWVLATFEPEVPIEA